MYSTKEENDLVCDDFEEQDEQKEEAKEVKPNANDYQAMQNTKMQGRSGTSPKSLIDAEGFKMPKSTVDISAINDPNKKNALGVKKRNAAEFGDAAMEPTDNIKRLKE